jgi:hypothetical protein
MLSTALTDWPEARIYSGMVLRFPAIAPYEDWVDFMLVVLPSQVNALLVTTGYKAGLIPQILPPEAGPTGALDRDWLLANWSKWVFPSTPVDRVYVVRGYSSLAPEPE